MRALSAILIAALLSGCQAETTAGRAGSGVEAVVAGTAAASEPGLASPDGRTAAAAFVETCLESFRDPVAGLLPRLRASGWEATAFAGPTAYEVFSPAAGIGGVLSSDAGAGFCSVGPLAALDDAKSIVDGIVTRRFSAIAQPGAMEGDAGPCDGWVLFPRRGSVVIAYDGLGNDPVCPDPDGTNIRVSTSSS